MTSLTWDRHHGHAADYDVVAIGTNVRPTELQAALGTAGLDDLPTNNEGRRQTLRQYADGFAGSAVRLIFDGDQRTTAHLAVVVLPEPGIRSRIRDAMTEAGIQTSFHYPPIHQFTAYADLPSRALPNTEAAAERLVTLPLHPYLTDSDVAVVVETLLKAV